MRACHLPYLGWALLSLVSFGCSYREPKADASETKKPDKAAEAALSASKTSDARAAAKVDVAGLATCEPTRAAMQSTLATLAASADADSDGKISRPEAESLVNFLVGGFMFRADENGDGTVTPSEGRKVRMELTEQHPALAALLAQVRAATGTNPFHELASLLDVNYEKPVKASDARAVALVVLDDVFKVADQNHDGAITESEARAAGMKGENALGEQAFAAADANSDGYLDEKEFERPLEASARIAFRIADANDDDKLTKDEARAALGGVVRQIGLLTTMTN